MSHTITLIGPEDQAVLSSSLVIDLSNQFQARHTILADGVAAELHFSSTVPPHLEETIDLLTRGLPLDVVLQPSQGREKKILIADMDSTIIEQECLDELAEFAGVRDEIVEITERAMRGELEFEPALRERVAKLKGLSVHALTQTFDERLSLMPGAIELVRTMNARGAITALVSGGFTFFTEKVAERVGFQANQGNVLEIENECLTGGLVPPILGQQAKHDALMQLCESTGLSPNQALAVGDGANDLQMLKAAGTGVAYRAKPIVAEATKVRIQHADLRALLYLQGIPRAAFVKA